MTLPVLQSDCSSCFGLCCVLLPFSAVSGFGVDKPGGRPCHHLGGDDREPAAALARAGRLDCGVERKQVRLLGDAVDELRNLLNRLGDLRQAIDRL